MIPMFIKRGTRAGFNALVANDGLISGEPYFITDEGVLAVGTGVNSYVEIGPFVPPAPSWLAFDAEGNVAAARPAVPSTTTVAWFNTPGQPTNLGPVDVWEDID